MTKIRVKSLETKSFAKTFVLVAFRLETSRISWRLSVWRSYLITRGQLCGFREHFH